MATQVTLNSGSVDSAGSLALKTNGTTTAVTINTSQGVEFNAGAVGTPSITTTGDTNTGIFFPAADTIAFSEGGVESMRIDASGNVGIGTSSPDASSRLTIFSATYPSLYFDNNSATGGGAIRFHKQGVQQGLVAASGWILADTSNDISMLANTGNGLRFYTNGSTERARIDSSGNLLVGTTSAFGGASRVCVTGPATANQQQISCHNPSTSGTRLFVAFGTEATYTERGWIQWNGSTMALTNASDSRLKENIVNAPSALTKIAAMQIRSFDFKEDGRHVDYGVVAQELNEVLPSAVFEGSDNEDGSINKPWSVGLEPIIPILVKAIQEQQAIITQLQADVAALKGTA